MKHFYIGNNNIIAYKWIITSTCTVLCNPSKKTASLIASQNFAPCIYEPLLYYMYLEMRALSYIFTTMKWFGIWQPIEWSSQWKINFYWLYTLIVVFALSCKILSKIVYLVKYFEDPDEIANGLFITLSETSAVYKIANILNRRRDIILFTDSLFNGFGKPKSPHEIKLQKEFDGRNRRITILYNGLVGFTIFSMCVVNYRKNVPQRILPDNGCFPFDQSTGSGYWFAYIYQVVSQTFLSVLCIAYDTLFCGLMGQTCAQLRILQYRLESVQSTSRQSNENANIFNNERSIERIEKRVLEHCICHHHYIFKCTTLINKIFGAGILIQYAVSTFVLCCSIYMLSQVKLSSPEFISIAAYMTCMLIQLFLYCWHGNEIILESMNVRNAAYSMDWRKLKLRTQKCILILMDCTLEPIKFTSASIIVLSLDTYKNLIKLSYSMYNLLQQSSEH